MAGSVSIDDGGGVGGGAPASGNVILTTVSPVFPPTDDADLHLDRWRKVRVFVSAFLTEPELKHYNDCDMHAVEVFARSLIVGVASEFWLHYADCIQAPSLCGSYVAHERSHGRFTSVEPRCSRAPTLCRPNGGALRPGLARP